MYGYGAWNPTLSYPQPFLHPETFAMQGFHPGAIPIPWQNPFIASAMFRNAFQQNPYLQTPLSGLEFAGLNPAIGSRPVPIGFVGSPEVGQGGAGAGFAQPAFIPQNFGGHLSPQDFVFGAGRTTGNYLTPEFLEFIRAELIRVGRGLRTVANALENDNEQVKTQAQIAVTAQFFYALGLLYTRGIILPRDVPGASVREDVSPTLACESFGESLERFAREQTAGPFAARDVGELVEKGRVCFRALAPETEQLERFKEERFKVEKKRAS